MTDDTTTEAAVVPLHADGTLLLLQRHATGLPSVLWWGRADAPADDDALQDLAAAVSRQTPPATLDAAWRTSILPAEADGWSGRPGLLALRDGRPVLQDWTTTRLAVEGRTAVVEAEDARGALALTWTAEILTGGLIEVRATLRSTGDGEVEVSWLEPALPAPKAADVLLEFTGRWTREKAPAVTPVRPGSTVRQTRRGRSGHDAPNVLVVGAGEPRNRSGEVWGVHLGWSADVTYRTDRLAESETLIGAGELLRPAEVRLGRGDEYATPSLYFACADDGLDGLSARFHTYLRSRPQHPRSPRPLVLNTWEAVYFDHDPAALTHLADVAASVGVERFVLDDGWFMGRRDDTRGLGDWRVDPAVWPDGLDGLAAHVHGRGMQFGLWFEPEMVNLDSELARAHPEWLLHDPQQVPSPPHLSFRTQYVLDLADPDAYAAIRDAIAVLVERLGIDFIKWDHNRDLVDAVHDGRPGVHAQTRAAYRLLGELQARFPDLEIESCSSGGARTDLGILQVTDRVWASDSNDPVERQDIQRWTQLLLPPELVGAHVGPTESHSSGRTTDLSYRAATSLMGSAGFEWDIASLGEDDLAAVRRFGDLVKELRPVIHAGAVVHADTRDPALRVTGAVAPDRSAGVWTIATVASLADSLPERIRLHGLDPDRRYEVRVRDEAGAARWGWVAPEWVTRGSLVTTGALLDRIGVQIPALWPMQALVLHVVAR